MLWCRECENGIYETETDISGECPICGSCKLTYGCRCESCGSVTEEDVPALCSDCKDKVKKKWEEFKQGLGDTEKEYFLDNVIEWEDFDDPY